MLIFGKYLGVRERGNRERSGKGSGGEGGKEKE